MTSINHAEVAETLHRAADLIEERGWRRGPATGTDSSWDWAGSGTVPLCLEGAIFAAHGHPQDWVSEDINECPAGAAVRHYLETPDVLWGWNDERARTATEVVEVLRATAAIEQAKHDAEVTSPRIPAFDTVAEMRAIAGIGASAAGSR